MESSAPYRSGSSVMKTTGLIGGGGGNGCGDGGGGALKVKQTSVLNSDFRVKKFTVNAAKRLMQTSPKVSNVIVSRESISAP